MQRDLKVGLSLGVLVLGVVAALVFRKEEVSTHKPTLKTAQQIDERIAERTRTPYMTGDVEFDQDDSTDSKDKDDQAKNGRPDHAVTPSWLNDNEDPFQVARTENGQFDFPNRSRSKDSAIVPLQPRSSATGHESTASQPAVQTHVIESGDSLSLLAERYLGSQGRFQEIYDANRDVLTDVNRLPLGASIVIPAASKTTLKPQSTTTSRTAMSHSDRTRTTITDISTIEPISPPSTTSAEANDTAPKASTEQPAKELPATPKLREAKKFVTPNRLPFTNRNLAAATNPHRKVLDPEGEEFTQSKPAATGDAASSTTADTRHYQVRKGDSLAKIATKVYGNAKRASDIFAANRSLLASPDAVREGQELMLPE